MVGARKVSGFFLRDVFLGLRKVLSLELFCDSGEL